MSKRKGRAKSGRNFQRVLVASIGAGLGADDQTAVDSRTRQLSENPDTTYTAHLAMSAETAIRSRIKRLHLRRRWP